MNVTFSGIFKDAADLWRRDRDLLSRIGAIFFFLPALASQFFLPAPDLSGSNQAEMNAALLKWMSSYGGWMFAQLAVVAFGSGVIFLMFLSVDRPALVQALKRMIRLFPSLLLTWTLVLLAMSLGSMLLLVVAFYMGGRALLSGALVVAEPERGPIGSIVESVKLSHRRGWMFSAVGLLVVAGSYALAAVPQLGITVLSGAGAANQLALAPLQLLSSAASAAGTLALVLVQISAYRLVKQGI